MSVTCPSCGAHYGDANDSCDARFNALLALDHSRREPWGSRHGQAFAAFALQHPDRYPTSLDRAWVALHRIYVEGQPSAEVFEMLRTSASPPQWIVPARATRPAASPATTIADLADFAAETYPARLDDWCRAALAMWTAT